MNEYAMFVVAWFFSFSPSSLSHRVLFGNPFYKWNDFKWQSRNAMIHFMMFLSHIYRFGAFFSLFKRVLFIGRCCFFLLFSSYGLVFVVFVCMCLCAAICLKHIFQRIDIFACKNTLLDDRCLFYLKLSGCFFFLFHPKVFFVTRTITLFHTYTWIQICMHNA